MSKYTHKYVSEHLATVLYLYLNINLNTRNELRLALKSNKKKTEENKTLLNTNPFFHKEPNMRHHNLIIPTWEMLFSLCFKETNGSTMDATVTTSTGN